RASASTRLNGASSTPSGYATAKAPTSQLAHCADGYADPATTPRPCWISLVTSRRPNPRYMRRWRSSLASASHRPPTRDTIEGRAYLDLQNLARRQQRPTDELHQLYALEGFLCRLAASEHAGRFALKGGILMAAYGARRPTRDVDLHAGRCPTTRQLC